MYANTATLPSLVPALIVCDLQRLESLKMQLNTVTLKIAETAENRKNYELNIAHLKVDLVAFRCLALRVYASEDIQLSNCWLNIVMILIF